MPVWTIPLNAINPAVAAPGGWIEEYPHDPLGVMRHLLDETKDSLAVWSSLTALATAGLVAARTSRRHRHAAVLNINARVVTVLGPADRHPAGSVML